VLGLINLGNRTLVSEISGTKPEPLVVLSGTNSGHIKRKEILAYNAAIMPRNMGTNRWLQLPEIARLFGLSEDSISAWQKTMVYRFGE
jgi:hypothetical protein